MAEDSELDSSLQELSLNGKSEFKIILPFIYLFFFLLFAIVEFRTSVKTPLIKRSKQKDEINYFVL